MPIYEYRCGECGHQLEALQKMSEQPLLDCPVCAKPALDKLISAAAFHLTGSGWYKTDSKADAKKNPAGGGKSASPAATSSPAADTPTSTATAAKSGTQSTTKPVTKTGKAAASN
ncbi:MAG: zinc ribbon domain-containing protein [Motiliproteus sp.]